MEKYQRKIINDYLKDKTLLENNIDLQKIICKISSKLTVEEQMKLVSMHNLFDKKIIVISDTHFGSLYENYKYIDNVYEFATVNNIKTILHCGDLMQGSVKPRIDVNQTLKEQAYSFIRNYPLDVNIDNYICLGNHDYFMIKENNDILKIINLREDINILGFKKVYLSWCNYLFSMCHHLNKYKIDVPRLETIIKFCGHRHELFIKDSYFFLPTLSDDVKYYINKENYPGFITCELNDNNIEIYLYQFINEKLIDKGLKLTRELNERAIIK